MAARLLQKVASASGISRSSFLVANGRGASAPTDGIITLSHLFHKVAVHPSVVVSKIPGYGSIKIPGAPSNPSKGFLSNRGIHGFAARNLNCSHMDAKTTFLPTRVPSIVSNCMKPSKQTFSSQGREIHINETSAKFAAFQAKSEAELAAMDADSNRFMKTQKWLWSFSCVSFLVGIVAELELKRIRRMKSQRIRHKSHTTL